jgi:hypothetical protein
MLSVVGSSGGCPAGAHPERMSMRLETRKMPGQDLPSLSFEANDRSIGLR